MHKCKYCGKEFDNPYKLGGHISRCKQNPNHTTAMKNWSESWKRKNSGKIKTRIQHKSLQRKPFNSYHLCYCQYCGKEYTNKNSLLNHERLCPNNPNRQISPIEIYNKKKQDKLIPGTNQYIKAKQLGLPKPEISEETQEKFRNVWLGKKLSDEMKNNIRNSVKTNIENNTWHNIFGIKSYYKDICFDSSWEVEFAKFLDNKNIKWIRPKKSFQYIFENSEHLYFPDFYLSEYNLYIEIKGVPVDKDYAKWSQFPEQLDIYDMEDLYKLGIFKSFDTRILVKEEYKTKHIDLNNL